MTAVQNNTIRNNINKNIITSIVSYKANADLKLYTRLEEFPSWSQISTFYPALGFEHIINDWCKCKQKESVNQMQVYSGEGCGGRGDYLVVVLVAIDPEVDTILHENRFKPVLTLADLCCIAITVLIARAVYRAVAFKMQRRHS